MSVSEMPRRDRSDSSFRFGRRRVAALVVGVVMVINVGCYTYQPLVDTRPQPGQQVALDLSDQGRAALGGQLGSGVLRVEGTLENVENDQYVVAVSRVVTISNGTANWGGEHVSIPMSDVSRAGLRTLSRGRSMLLAGAVAAGIGAFIISRGVVGGGTIPGDTTGKPPVGTDRTGGY